jgi:flagellar hook-length control protein FliK
MDNAIKNTGKQPGQASSLADVLSRMSSGKPGAESEAGSFANLMSQHQVAQPGSLTSALADRPKLAGSRGANHAGARLPASRVNQPHPSANPEPDRSSPNAAARQGPRPLKAREDTAPKQPQRVGSPNRAAPAEDGPEVSRAKLRERGDPSAERAEDINNAEAVSDVRALDVNELVPPADVRPNDPVGMMAWLVSLTQLGSAPQLAPDAPAAGDGVEGDALLARDGGRGESGLGGRGLSLRASLLQRELILDPRAAATSSAAALQVDALLGRGASPSNDSADSLVAMLPPDGVRPAFAQTLSQATALRHEQASIPVPLDSPDFSQKLADQVRMWVGQASLNGPMTAELHLNPAEMGPINVKISLEGSAAQVDFAAAALETRQAIEASLSMLSSALDDVGLSLAGGGVSSQTPQQTLAGGGNREQGAGAAGKPDGSPQHEEADDPGTTGLRQVSLPRSSRLGGLDLYA